MPVTFEGRETVKISWRERDDRSREGWRESDDRNRGGWRERDDRRQRDRGMIGVKYASF
ncbi:hypothetical protein LguiA_002416 [Lonicera macranthoides]